MWAREAISANTERRCRRWIMRHNQPLKVLLTSELLTIEFTRAEGIGCNDLLDFFITEINRFLIVLFADIQPFLKNLQHDLESP